MHALARLLLAALLPGLLSFAVVTAGPADAANKTPGCVTKAEYRKIKKGMSIKRVRALVGQRGKTVSHASFGDGDAMATVEFRQCGRSWTYSSISVSTEMSEREVYVPDVVCYDFDGDGYEEDCEDYGSYETVYRAPMVVTSKYAYWF
ncbi:hypothetical protein [Nocardioides litoris]|uniref:hypothetical protein n=1 Tax=Nocardioides litoris TaxID=1926648 RepID=UPI001123105A|nr:hypothetical protein [Nocardioides litoris]